MVPKSVWRAMMRRAHKAHSLQCTWIWIDARAVRLHGLLHLFGQLVKIGQQFDVLFGVQRVLERFANGVHGHGALLFGSAHNTHFILQKE